MCNFCTWHITNSYNVRFRHSLIISCALIINWQVIKNISSYNYMFQIKIDIMQWFITKPGTINNYRSRATFSVLHTVKRWSFLTVFYQLEIRQKKKRKRHLLEEGGKFLAVSNTCKIVILIGLNSDTTTHVLLFIV